MSHEKRTHRLTRLVVVMAASGCMTAPVVGQTTLIYGDAGQQIVLVPPSVLPPFNTLILGNQATGDGQLTFSAGALNVNHGGGYSGYVTVGNSGNGVFNHSNADGNATIGINGPQYVSPSASNSPDPWGGYLFIARNDGSTGSYVMTDAGNGNALSLNVQREIQIGGSNVSTLAGGGFSCNINCNGSFVQNGGTVTAAGVTIGIGGGTGSYTINSGTLNAFLDVGNSSSFNNTFTQNGGVVNADMFVGNGSGAQGTYSLNGGVLNSGFLMSIGGFGTGTFQMLSGTVNSTSVAVGDAGTGVGSFSQLAGEHFAHELLIGAQTGSVGTYTLEAGSLLIGAGTTDRLVVGHSGQGTFNMTGGSLDIQNGDINTGAFVVGNNAGSVGIVNQSGGAVTGGRSLGIGINGGSGTYNLSNSDPVNQPTTTLDVGFVSLGFNGTGAINQSAGTRLTTGSIYIGADHGTYNLNGGELLVTDTDVQIGRGSIIGTFGTGTFNQSGGTHTTDSLVLGARNDAQGFYNLSGGDLVVNGRLFVGLGHDQALNPNLLNGTFAQSGGTVNAGEIIVGGYTEFIANPSNPSSPTIISHLGTGLYQLSAGVVTAGATSVGNTSQGRVQQTGGTFNAGALSLGSSGLFALANGPDFAYYSEGIYELQGGQLNTTGTTVSVFGRGSFIQSGSSTHTVTGNLVVGSQPGPTAPSASLPREGVYSFQAGVLNVSGTTTIAAGNNDFAGEPGALGSFSQSGGVATLSGDFVVGSGGTIGGGAGTFTQTGGQMAVGGDMRLGSAGLGTAAQGTATQSAGSTTVTGGLFLGSGNGTGTYNLSSSAVLSTAITYVGEGGPARFNQSGGTHNTNFLNVGIFAGSDSIYTMSGGNLVVANNLGLGGVSASTAQFKHSAGTVQVNDGTFGLFIGSHGAYSLSGSAVLQVAATTDIGGVQGGGVLNQSGGSFSSAAMALATGAGTAGAFNLSGGTAAVSGTVQVGSGGGAGTLAVSGGSLSAAQVINNSQVQYLGGSIAANVANNALFNVAGGAARTLTGNFSNNLGGQLTLAAASPLTITGVLTNAPTATIQAASNITVGADFNNQGAGSGNSFNRRANVSGAGQILAAGAGAATAQTLSGAITGPVTSGNAVLDFGAFRVGDPSSTLSYAIGNANTGGPLLRGALQTSSALGANISDARLGGAGVTAGNWGPVAAGASSAGLAVTFTASSAGALVNQKVGIVNNFDNTNSQLLTLNAKAYTPAVAQLNTSTVNFGIVHVNEVVANRNISVGNNAAPTALNDVLQASMAVGATPFVASGSLGAGVAAGSTNASGLQVGLNTGTAGFFSSSASVAFASHNADMSDAALGSQNVALSAQVNNYAVAGLAKSGGQGSFSGAGNTFTLDFGVLVLGDAGLSAQLSVHNLALGPADLLAGSFNLGTAGQGDNFSLTGFTAFSNVAGGASFSGLSVSFGTAVEGVFDKVVVLSSAGSNASGYNAALGDVQLHLVGSVAAVPEPSTYALMAGGLLALWLAVRRRQALPQRRRLA